MEYHCTEYAMSLAICIVWSCHLVLIIVWMTRDTFLLVHMCAKMPKMHDTCHFVMLPHHHANVSMMPLYYLYDLYGHVMWHPVGLPCGTPILPIFSKLQTTINFSYKLCLYNEHLTHHNHNEDRNNIADQVNHYIKFTNSTIHCCSS
jgi:hypothetical protein